MTEEEKAKDEHIKALEKQVWRYRGALRCYWDRLTEVTDKADTLSYALDTFTERHPEYAEEIKAQMDHRESPQKNDDDKSKRKI